MNRVYITYDERAVTMGTDKATVLSTAHSLKEAVQDCKDSFQNGAIFSYQENNGTLTDEKLEKFIG